MSVELIMDTNYSKDLKVDATITTAIITKPMLIDPIAIAEPLSI